MFKKRMLSVLIVLAMMFTLIPVVSSVDAASKSAVKVTHVTKYNDSGQQVTTLYGKASDGTTVWKYKCQKVMATELRSVTYIKNGKDVFVIDNKYFVRIRLRDGKVLVKKKIKGEASLWGATMLVDKSKNVYAIGYYGNTLYKFNKKGKVLWTTKAPDKYFWPHKLKLSGKRLRITYDQPGTPSYYSVNIKTGKKWKK